MIVMSNDQRMSLHCVKNLMIPMQHGIPSLTDMSKNQNRNLDFAELIAELVFDCSRLHWENFKTELIVASYPLPVLEKWGTFV